ncbi:MAG: hypothetical protein K1X88_08020, partial [Nannocystaceae bacterium]|nr:hypothetical protein [Nannocystaceae bacterium]
MSRSEICPTCGTKLGPTHARVEMRVCTACQRSNPTGFSYCGFCASPMENTEMRARMSELAAPPGGWPNLTSELVEVRFYLQQGLFDDAYELLSIMQKRYPGHPQLNELTRRPKPSRRVDTGVLALVDSVLAESANLVAKVPRRAAPHFQAPSPGSPARTDVHPTLEEAEAAAPRARSKTGGHASARGSGPRASIAPTGAHAKPVPAIEVSRAARAASTTRAAAEPQPETREAGAPAPAPRERTQIYRTVDAPVRAAPPISTAPRPPSGAHATTATPAPAPAAARTTGSSARTPVPVRAAEAPRASSAQPARAPEAARTSSPQPARAPEAVRASSPQPARAAEAPRASSQRSAERSTGSSRTTAPPRQAAVAGTVQTAAPAASTATPIDTPRGGTEVRPVPQTGHTMVVDALQPAAPFQGDAADGRRGRGGRRRRDADAPAAEAQAAEAPAAEP